MFEPIPESKTSNSNYLRWKDVPISGQDSKGQNIKKVRLRIMGTNKIPESFMQCWLAWEEYMEEEDGKMVKKNRPHREAYSKRPSEYLVNIDKDENPKSAWNTIVWNADEGRPMVWEITQGSIKDGIIALANNPAWGGKAEDGTPLKDASRFIIEVSKTGDGYNTTYLVNPEPPSELPDSTITDAVAAAQIDVRVLVTGDNNGDPFGALATVERVTTSTDDQANIQQIQDTTPPAAVPEKNEEMPANAVGNVALDAITNLKAAQAKSTGGVQDDIPF